MKKFFLSAAMALLCYAGALAQSSFETALTLQEGVNTTPALEMDYSRGAYFKYEAAETSVISLTPGDGGNVSFYVNGEQSYDYTSTSNESYVYTYSLKVAAGQTVYVLAKQGYSSATSNVIFDAKITTGVFEHGMVQDDPIALEMGKEYWFEGGNAYFTYTASDDGVVVFKQYSYCYDASYTVDGSTKSLAWDSNTREMNMPVVAGKTYSMWTSASPSSIFSVSARFTQPKQGETIDNPFSLTLGNNTVPAAAGKYYFKFLNEDDPGFLTVSAEGAMFAARTTGNTYDNLSSNNYGTMKLQMDMDQEVIITVEKTEATAEDQIMTASFELPQVGDLEINPIVLTSSESDVVSSPSGVKFYSITNTGSEKMFLNVHVDTEGVSSYGNSQVRVYEKGAGYQWGGSSISSNEDFKTTIEPNQVYMIYVKNAESGAINFRAWISEIAKGDTYSSPIVVESGENTVSAAGQKFYAYTAKSTCRLSIAVGNAETTTLFFPAYNGDQWMGISLLSSDNGVYVLAAEEGSTYVFRMTGAAVGDKFTVTENPYKAGQSRSNPIEIDGKYEFDDMNPYDVWLVYEVKTTGVAEVTANGFGAVTYDDNIYFALNDDSEYGNNLRGNDADYNLVMQAKSLPVKAGDKIFFHVCVASYQEGASFTVSVREPNPGESAEKPIALEVNKANTIDAVAYLDSPRWYTFEVTADCDVTFSTTESCTIMLFDADLNVIPCGVYSPSMSVGGYYGDFVKALAAGKYYVAITYTPGCELTVSGSSIATGIATVGSKAQKSSTVYNLAGQRVNAEMKGIHIVNGKAVIVK